MEVLVTNLLVYLVLSASPTIPVIPPAGSPGSAAAGGGFPAAAGGFPAGGAAPGAAGPLPPSTLPTGTKQIYVVMKQNADGSYVIVSRMKKFERLSGPLDEIVLFCTAS